MYAPNHTPTDSDGSSSPEKTPSTSSSLFSFNYLNFDSSAYTTPSSAYATPTGRLSIEPSSQGFIGDHYTGGDDQGYLLKESRERDGDVETTTGRLGYKGAILSSLGDLNKLTNQKATVPSTRYKLDYSVASIPFDIEHDLVPVNTFALVDWMRDYDMGVYFWRGTEKNWTEFAMHIPPQYHALIHCQANYIRNVSGCVFETDTEILRGTISEFLILHLEEPGEVNSNKSLIRALEALSMLIQGALSAPPPVVSGGRRRGPQNAF
jgi:hypothetical protein